MWANAVQKHHKMHKQIKYSSSFSSLFFCSFQPLSKALVAFEGRDEVTQEDIGRVIGSCLSHRLRKDVTDTLDNGFKVTLAFNKVFKGSAMLNFEETMAEGIKAPEPEKPKDEKPKEEPKKKAGAWTGLPGGR